MIPIVVPALQQWHPAQVGTWRRTADTRVVGGAEARTLARDLGVRTARHARAGDIVIARRRGLGREGYELRVGRRLRITASTRAGAYYGGRTVLQLKSIPYGRARDAPRYAERALMIDCGRAFFSRKWLSARIRELGSLKLNTLHLHLSDDQGFRIESRRHPEAVTKPFLTYADVAALRRVAARNHVTLVPEIDMPGHLTAALRAHPELELTNLAGQRQAGKLDISKPEARKYAFDLIDETLGLFKPRIWHMGADEYLGVASTPADYELYPQLEAYADTKYGEGANGKDAVLDFVNAVGDRVRSRGIELRAWSDGAGGGSEVSIDPRTSIEWWDDAPEHSPPPAELIAAGHDVLNTGWWPLYYVTGGPLMSHRAPIEQMYENWRAWEFDGEFSQRFGSPALGSEYPLDPKEPKQRGASLAVWNDDPAAPGATEKAIAEGIAPRLRVLAQRTWGSPDQFATYEQFRMASP